MDPGISKARHTNSPMEPARPRTSTRALVVVILLVRYGGIFVSIDDIGSPPIVILLLFTGPQTLRQHARKAA
ncbi:uncharacterized protein N7446_008754 [Penicillium canescens]|uniref:Uncharacterized protein n=1 Tax=Penicillium canescens TaxID=5083 RepID=A0AAD6IR13_PENCN|nr:uncharacterized protein N7446_008754 [Penicillium canescens]KAJ6032952.1 hypothetical protein N7444_010723 [Penicillium canescens]KAJ6057858.1 hypothetical protein N7460_001132 [Penicillium canescens]KAJ6059171.1 hypothetical protein N7446_008754 [Penicillium canescens]